MDIVYGLGPWRIAVVAALCGAVPFALGLFLMTEARQRALYLLDVAEVVFEFEKFRTDNLQESLRRAIATVERNRKNDAKAQKQYDKEQREWRKNVDREARVRPVMPRELRLAVFKRDGFMCCDCGYQAHDSRGRRLHVDHIIPVSLGGTNDIDNLQTLCDLCNIRKSDKLPDTFTRVAKVGMKG